jgi:hypothetical protein
MYGKDVTSNANSLESNGYNVGETIDNISVNEASNEVKRRFVQIYVDVAQDYCPSPR